MLSLAAAGSCFPSTFEESRFPGRPAFPWPVCYKKADRARFGRLEMKRIVIFAVAAIALSACANPEMAQYASNQCQAVGVTEKDPNYAACTKAMLMLKREDQLRWAYQKMKPMVPYDRMIPHADVNIY